MNITQDMNQVPINRAQEARVQAGARSNNPTSRPQGGRRPCRLFLGTLAALACGLAGNVRAAAPVTYTYYTATDAADTSWVSPPNSVPLKAVNWGGGDTVYGGVTWLNGTYGGVAYNDAAPIPMWFSIPGIDWGWNYGGFYPGGPALLTQGAYQGASCRVDIGGLTAGTRYLVQFVLADSRGGGVDGRQISIQSRLNVTGDSDFLRFAYADGRYAVVTADFTADATQVAFEPTMGDGTQINGVQVHEWTSAVRTITASAPVGATITPAGAVRVADGGSRTFTIAGSMTFAVTDVLVDDVPQGPVTSYTFTNVTADHTIVVLGEAATTTISGNVLGLPAGEEATVTVVNTATAEKATATTSAGAYSVTAGNGTYSVSARGSGLLWAPAVQVVVSGASVVKDITLIATPLIDIRADGMPIGPIASAANTGTLGGSFAPSGNGPSVDVVNGKQAMQFTGSGYLQLGVGAPAGLIGNATTPPVYSHIAWVYRPNLDGGPNVFLSWAPYPQGALWQYGFPGERYADHWAAGWDMWWSGQCPPAGSWHSLVTTCDGVTEKLYIDGNSTPALSVGLGGNKNFQNGSNNYPVRVGAMGWWDGADPDRYYTGAIASVQVWPFAIAAADVAAAAAAIAPVEPANAHTIHASADANSSITPTGDVVVADGGSQTFTMTAGMQYNISDVVVDSVSEGVRNSWTFSGVTGDHTISVSSILATTHIMGIVSGLPAGETAQVTAKGATGSATVTTGTDGSYVILAGNGTYTVTARGSGLLSAGPLPVTISDVDATLDMVLTTTPLVDLRADALPTGSVSSATNTGTLGGNLVPTGANPSVGAAGGKKAVLFNRTPLALKDSGGSLIAPPAAILGANGGPTPKYTVSAWLYRDSIAETSPWSAGWLSWSVGDHCAWFQYNGGNDGWGHCVDYWGSGYGTINYPGGAPAAGAWYHFCVTCDGSTTTLWITYPDGSVHSTSSGGSGFFYPDSSIYIGEIAPSHEGGRPFIGGIASLELWNVSITAADLPMIRAIAPPADATTPYQNWLTANGNLPNTAANLQTFAFGLDLTGGASPVTVAPNPTVGEFKYTRRKDTGLAFGYESSTTLDNWQPFTPVAPTPTVAGINDSLEEVTIQIPADLLANPSLFVRVKVAE